MRKFAAYDSLVSFSAYHDKREARTAVWTSRWNI